MTIDDDSGELRPRRRQVLRAATATVIGAGAVTAGGAGILRLLDSDGDHGRLMLTTDASSGVGILEERLADLGLARAGKQGGKPLWETPVLNTQLVTMIGFTWRNTGAAPSIMVRFRGKGGWSLWRPVAALHDGPDPSSGEGSGKAGTVPLVVPPSDRVQVQVTGSLPPALSITLIHAAPIASDAKLAALGGRAVGRSVAGQVAARSVAAPAVYSRAQWGANENWRDGKPRYNDTILQAHVHHSASGNGYAQADVPALIRSFYKYHTKSLGWADIGYNFLVDSYGGIWEGRAGGIDQAVRGAHTLGFNASSVGICVIGNLETTAPTAEAINAVGQVAGWKLALYGRDPQGWTQVTSEGSDKFKKGKVVTLPVIDGHRDTNSTACPGRNLYDQLPTVRAIASGAGAAAALKLKTPYRLEGKPILGRTLLVTDGKFKPKKAAVSYQWTRGGLPIEGAVGSSYALTPEDVGQVVGVVITGALEGAEPVTQALETPVPVRSKAQLEVQTQTKAGGKLIVKVLISAPGIAVPDGNMRIAVGRRVRTVKVKKGKAIARFLKVPPGRFQVVCKYKRGTMIRPKKATTWIEVARS